jgi:hypothetical protein
MKYKARVSDNSPEYQAIHKRLRKERGLARAHECGSCDKKARDWAYIHGLDPDDIWSYTPMCSGCHRSYDHYHRKKGRHISKNFS